VRADKLGPYYYVRPDEARTTRTKNAAITHAQAREIGYKRVPRSDVGAHIVCPSAGCNITYTDPAVLERHVSEESAIYGDAAHISTYLSDEYRSLCKRTLESDMRMVEELQCKDCKAVLSRSNSLARHKAKCKQALAAAALKKKKAT